MDYTEKVEMARRRLEQMSPSELEEEFPHYVRNGLDRVSEMFGKAEAKVVTVLYDPDMIEDSVVVSDDDNDGALLTLKVSILVSAIANAIAKLSGDKVDPVKLMFKIEKAIDKMFCVPYDKRVFLPCDFDVIDWYGENYDDEHDDGDDDDWED